MRHEEGAGSGPPQWHALPLEDVLGRLKARADGLTGEEAAERLARHGPNELPAPRRRGLLRIVAGQLRSPLIYLLLAAGTVSVAFGEVDDALFIALVLTINTALGTVQEWRAEANSAALRRTLRTTSTVVRDGVARRVDGAALVPGDRVILEAGERVPADLRLTHARDLEADESALTGESVPVGKVAGAALVGDTTVAERRTMLHAATVLRRGRGEGVVVATGHETELGHIARALDAPAPDVPLTRRLERFSRTLGLFALGLVALVIGLQLAAGASLRETFFVAVALAVSVIPEGLPVAVTVALSIATRRMAKRNVIVRHLPAVEALGACTVVATDKTGTLTLNRLTAKRLWLPGRGWVEVGGDGFDRRGEFLAGGIALDPEGRAAVAALARAGLLCNDAHLGPDGGEEGASGDTVDLAFLVLAAKAGVERGTARRRDEIPFSAEKRLAATLDEEGIGAVLHVKGAAEVVLPRCENLDLRAAAAEAEALASEGYRVLAVARRTLDPAPNGAEPLESHLHGLTLLGLVGFIDPLRPEARDAVAACRGAGVRVVMITGDHAATALAIARQLGIADQPGEVMTGRDLVRAQAAGDEAAIADVGVFARVEPTQKVAIVDALRARGHVVAMTGDGVNDAPALRRADLGVAMGRGGTDVARDAADLVLTDDNFASVVAGIEEGRAAYANIRKVIILLVATGAAEAVLFLLSILSGLPAPLTAVQLLWLNLVTNGGQDVALAFEKREPGLLARRPRSPHEPLFDRVMIRQTVVAGLFMGVVSWIMFAILMRQGFAVFDARNLLLFLLVAFENTYVFACRSETRSAFRVPLAANRPLLVAVVAAQAIHVGAAFTPGLRDVLDVAPIGPLTWLALVPVAASVLPVAELEKFLRRRRGQ